MCWQKLGLNSCRYCDQIISNCQAVSIVSDALTLSNSGKQELMDYVHQVSSSLPPLGGVDAYDTIDTDMNFSKSLILSFQHSFSLLSLPCCPFFSCHYQLSTSCRASQAINAEGPKILHSNLSQFICTVKILM